MKKSNISIKTTRTQIIQKCKNIVKCANSSRLTSERRYLWTLPVTGAKFYPPLGPKRLYLLWPGCLKECCEAKHHPTSAPAPGDPHPHPATGKLSFITVYIKGMTHN